eukprot:scaffold201082_cov42-Prasinocladus_malaysianus.AAC.1
MCKVSRDTLQYSSAAHHRTALKRAELKAELATIQYNATIQFCFGRCIALSCLSVHCSTFFPGNEPLGGHICRRLSAPASDEVPGEGRAGQLHLPERLPQALRGGHAPEQQPGDPRAHHPMRQP